MQSKKILSLFIGLMAARGLAVGAESPVELSEDVFFSEMPVVLSVSRLAQPLRDAPGAVAVIDAEMIRKSGARDLSDLLRLVPGFQVAYGAFGAPIAVYHGITDENPRGLQVLVDGRSQYSLLAAGGVNWSMIDVALADVERIEILRGSNSAAFGSNAFLGVINIVTAHPAPGGRVAGYAANGAHGLQDRYLAGGARVGAAAVRASVERLSDDGLTGFHDSRTTRRFNLRGALSYNPTDSIDFHFGLTDVSLGIGVAGTENPARTRSFDNQFVQFDWRRTRASDDELLVRFLHKQEKLGDGFSVSRPPLFAVIDYDSVAERQDLELQKTEALAPSVRVVYGAGFRWDSLNSPQLYGTVSDVRQNLQRLFGNVEWRMRPDVVTNLGATWEKDSIAGTSFAPRAMANYHVLPEHTLRAGISRAQRIPTLFESRTNERYFDANLGILLRVQQWAMGDVKPETITSRELGYLGRLRDAGLFIDVRGFDERVKNRIAPGRFALTPPGCELLADPGGGFPCGDFQDSVNAQDLRIRGYETQVRWQPIELTTLTLNHTDARVRSNVYGGIPVEQREVLHMDRSMPQRSTSVIWQQTWGARWTSFVAWHNVGSMKWTQNTEAGEYRRVDFRVAYAFRLGASRGELSYTVLAEGEPHAEWVGNQVGALAVRNQYVEPRSMIGLRLEL